MRSSRGLTGYYLHPSGFENAVLHPVKGPPAGIRPGLRKKIYQGYPKGILTSDLVDDVPIEFEWPSEPQKPCKSPFTIEWDGLLKIEHRDTYTFIVRSDDGSELFLNGICIIDNGGRHPPLEKREDVLLEPGFYRFQLHYFDQSGGATLSLKWRHSKIGETVIPPARFYHDPARNSQAEDSVLPYTLRIKPDDDIRETSLVFKKNDPSLAFKNYGILRTCYVNYWDNSRFEPPPEIPIYNIIWRGFLWIPEDGDYTFRVNTNGDAFFYVDEKQVIRYRGGSGLQAQVSLKNGWKPVQINYFNANRHAVVSLLWQKPGDRNTAIIPARYFKPFEDTGCLGGSKIWCAAGCIAIPLFVVLGIVLRYRSAMRYLSQRYVAYIKGNWGTASLIVIVILGAVLRLNNYSVVPPHGDTMDIYQEAWKGYHILHGEGPKTWAPSYFNQAYKDEDKKFIRWMGDDFMIVKGQIDHPPLFSLFAAIPPTICGARSFLDCRLTTINLTPVFFSTLTIILVFFVSYKIYRSHTIAVIAGLLYATVPLFVAAGRLAKGDCLLALVFVSGVLCVLKYAETKKKQYVLFAGLLAGTSYWCKEVGICAIVILPVLLGRKGHIKEACITAGIGIFVALGYQLYNYLVNPEAFFKIMALYNEHHLNRTRFDIVLRYLREPRLAQIPANFGMGYLLWFWFMIVYSMGKRDQLVSITVFIFLMTVCAASSDFFSYGWYLLPFYPFMAIAGGLFMRDFIFRPNTAKALLLLLVLMAVPLKEILPEKLQGASWLFRYCLAAGILPFLVCDFFRSRVTGTIAKVCGYVLIFFSIVINIYIVWHLPDVYDPLR